MDRRDWMLGLVMGGVHFAFHLFMRLIPPLIPVLTLALSAPLWKLGLLVSVYFAGSSIGLLPMGALSDRRDRRVLLSGALAVVAAGYLLVAAAPALGAGLAGIAVLGITLEGPFVLMTAGMFVAGLGTSAHIPVGVPIVTANASERNRGRLLGIWGGASKLGDAAAPAVVGVAIVAFGWREIVGAFGVAGLVGALGLYAVLGLERFETNPIGGRETAASAFRGDRRRYLYPMAALVGYFAAYNLAVQGVVAFTPTFVVDVYGYAPRVLGARLEPESFADFMLSALLLSAAASRFVGGALVDRYEHRAVLVGSLLVAGVALLSVSTLAMGPLVLLGVLVVFGAGLWGNSPARDSLISDLTPAGHEGRTFSYLWTASRVFGAVAPVTVGAIAGSVGIRVGFRYLAGATLVAGAFAALLFSDRVYAAGGEGRPATGPDD